MGMQFSVLDVQNEEKILLLLHYVWKKLYASFPFLEYIVLYFHSKIKFYIMPSLALAQTLTHMPLVLKCSDRLISS